MSAAKKLYETQIKQTIKAELGYTNVMQVPRLEKVVINICVPEATQDSKKIQAAYDDLMLIACQKPVITKAKNSIASFKLREGMNIGVKVTLRKDRMFEFIDRLVWLICLIR